MRARVLACVRPYVHASACVRAPSEVRARAWWLCAQWARSCMGACTVNVCRAQVLHACDTCVRGACVRKGCVCVCARSCSAACARMCLRVQGCLCARAPCARACVHTCVHKHIHVYIYIYIHIYICVRTQRGCVRFVQGKLFLKMFSLCLHVSCLVS